ncbi:hypothetical protein [Streptomyces sp. NPDC054837]
MHDLGPQLTGGDAGRPFPCPREFRLRAGQCRRYQCLGVRQGRAEPFDAVQEDGGLGDRALGGAEVLGGLLGVRAVGALAGLVEAEGGEHQAVLGLFGVAGDGGGGRGGVPLVPVGEERLDGPGAPGQCPEAALGDLQGLAQALLQRPQPVERGRLRVQPPPGLLAPSDDPGERVPPRRGLLRYAVVVLLPHPEGGPQLALRVPQGRREGRHGTLPEPCLDEGEFRTAGADAVVGRDEQGLCLCVEFTGGRCPRGGEGGAGSGAGPGPPRTPYVGVSRDRTRGAHREERKDEVGGRGSVILRLNLLRGPRDRGAVVERHPRQHQPHHPGQPAQHGVRHPHGYVRGRAPRPAPEQG